MFKIFVLMVSVGFVSSGCSAYGAQTIVLRADLTDAPRHLLHITELIPVTTGPAAFSYPQWIPGQERASGPIDNVAGILFHDDRGGVVAWRRDLTNPYTVHVNVPAGVRSLEIAFDVLDVPSPTDTTATRHTSSHVVMLEPSSAVLYPSDKPMRDIIVEATVHLPDNWKAATALRTGDSPEGALQGQDARFRPVSLEQFVDSPILAGDHCRQYSLAAEIYPAHTLDICSEKADELDVPAKVLDNMSNLVRQASAVFHSHHYDQYDFLIAVSPHLEGDSEEHGQSADYITGSLEFNIHSNSPLGFLLPHEYVHSWCGKYRRPSGIATGDYQIPMQNDLIWVYEGLTEYYGDVLAARAGVVTPAEVVDAMDQWIFDIDQPGKRWRSLQDTANASATLRGADPAWSGWRRGQAFYREGALVWLEADVKIRQLTHNQRSLDDFAAHFFGASPDNSKPHDTGPGVFPYDFADLVKALNETAPYDWKGFWNTRLNALPAQPLIGGLEAAGYSYKDADTMVPNEAAFMKQTHMAEMLHSLGVWVLSDGTLRDVWIQSPAFVAGLGPGDKLTTVNGKPYSPEVLAEAVRTAKTSSSPISLGALRDDEPKTFQVSYHGGERYASIERNGNSDLLTTAILKAK